MKLMAIRKHYVDGKRVDVDGTYEADATLGRQLIAAGKCVRCADEAGAKSPDKSAKPGPMTTKTSGGLVSGAATEKE